jgi:hypothetical protein
MMDYVNGSSKKLFVSDPVLKLYWWEVYHAMISGNYAFVCPCRLEGTRWVLCMILKTRCNKSNFDCLIYDMDDDKCFVLKQNVQKWFSNFICSPLETFDTIKVQE